MQQNYVAERPLGYQQLTSLASATALTVPAGTVKVVLTPTAQGVRYRDDGTDPTATVGMPIAAGETREYTAQSFSRLKFIEQAASAVLNASFYG